MSTPYGISTSIGSSTYNNYVNAPIIGPLSTNQYPASMPYHSYGTLVGQRPTPPQFYPGQEPIYSDMGINMRQQYLRTSLSNRQKALEQAIAKASAPFSVYNYSNGKHSAASSHMNYIEPIPSSMHINQVKAQAIGKSAFKVGLPLEAPISTKDYYPSGTRSSLRRARSSGSVAPKKKGSIYNTSLRNGMTCAWGSLPRQGY